MQNKCSNAILFIVVILPFTLLSYQNCSQLQSYEIEELSSQLNFENNEPLLVENMQSINYKAGSDCSLVSEDLLFYNPEYNLCSLALDTCQANFLQNQGYFLASDENCNKALSKDDMVLNAFTSQTPDELGYQADTDSYCTQVVNVHVNLFSRVCAYSSDGCEAQYLSENKFVTDNFGLCNYQ